MRKIFQLQFTRQRKLFKNSKFYHYASNTMRDYSGELEELRAYENLSVKDRRVKKAEKLFILNTFKQTLWLFEDDVTTGPASGFKYGIENVYAIATLVQLSHDQSLKMDYIATLFSLTRNPN